MMAALAHRGPDHQGLRILDVDGARLGLAHTRLAILDLSPAGRQPMAGPDEGSWITYNGEIYNFRELGERLAGRSGQFRSRTDTEVILKALDLWGLGAISRFRGMFAFAYWDQRTRKLIFARDPIGIKPLYFYQSGRTLVFASEVRALLASGLVPRRLSPQGLVSYLRTGSIEAPWTIIDGVQSLLPGHYAVAGCDGGLEQSRYDSGIVLPDKAARPASRSQAAAELFEILKESVRLHLVSDVPVGVFLSGGIDSSALVALMAQTCAVAPKTFSVVFAEKEYSEACHAKLVAERFGAEHREIPLTEGDLLRLLPDALSAMDQPTADGVNSFVVSKAVKDAGITVALSGLGGDELFAGYPSFRRALLVQRMLNRAPVALRRGCARVGGAVLNGSVTRRKFWELLGSDGSPAAAYSISRRLFSPAEIGRLTSFIGAWTTLEPCATEDPVNAISRMEMQQYMANTLLRDTDSMSMAHSLEVRVPFVDTAVIKYVLQIPGEWKISNGVPKPLLLDALGDHLPESIWRRPKMGFSLPFERWMRSALRTELDGAFCDAARPDGVRADAARSIWLRFTESPEKEKWSRAWALYVIRKWCELNRVQA